MNIKRILITGDDGYNAIGVRLLVHYLKADFDLFIAGTKDQQSGVGGHLSIRSGGSWGEDLVEGVPAFWVDGYPCDAIECMVGMKKKSFDLILSGINLGMNVGSTIVSSGTHSAAMRAVNLGLAPHAIVLSWHCPPSFWLHHHQIDEPLEPYLDNLGTSANAIIRMAIRQDFWGSDILNVNFPSEKSSRVRFTKGLSDPKDFFIYPVEKNIKTHRFAYPMTGFQTVTKGKLDIDTGAMLSGYISVTPQRTTLLDEDVYKNVKDLEITL